MSERNSVVQKFWGIILLLTGTGMMFAIPFRVRQIQAAGNYSDGSMIFLKICLYIIGIVLIIGGGKKLYTHVIRGGSADTEDNGS